MMRIWRAMLATATVILCAACGNGDAPPAATNPINLDPGEIFSKVSAGMDSTSSYRMEGDVVIEGVEGKRSATYRTDWSKPDRFHSVIRGLPDPDSYQEVIAVGQRAFRREDPAGPWEESDIGPTDPNLTGGLMANLSQVSWQSAVMESEDTIRLVGTETVSADMPSGAPVRTLKAYELEIADDSYLIEGLGLKVTVQQDQQTLSTQEAIYRFSAYGHPVTIEPPLP